MPKRSRSGVVSSPVRVVAPTSVNGGRSSVSVRAAEPCEDGRHVPLALECRPRHTANADAELLADDVREARLPETRRPDEQDVVERLVARLRGGQGNCELILDARLPDELGQAAWTERLVELLLLGGDRRRQELGAHLMLLSTPDGRVPPAAAQRRPRRGPALPPPRSSRARRARRARRDAVACPPPTRSAPAHRRAFPSARARCARPSSCRCRESPGSGRCPRARSLGEARTPANRTRSRARPSARRR